MRYVYICGAVSEKLCDQKQWSVAGNKFSLNMAKAIDTQCGGKLTVITTAGVQQKEIDEYGGHIWPGKPLYTAPRGKRFVLGDLVQRRNILKLLKRFQKQHSGEKLAVFIENSPFVSATACERAKKKWGISCYSITIDTPFTGQFCAKGIRGRINTQMFLRGRRALRRFDGLISFSEAVKKELQVDIPFCPFTIGCNPENIPEQLPEIAAGKNSVYAGTLIHYNGIRELLQAFAQLGEEYKLDIYGYGPMEEEVKAAAREHSNIVFRGRFDPKQTEQILSQYQLLINPRRLDPTIENFTFPSKLVDYILTGKSVLTTNFKTMPVRYREFLYVLEDLQPQTIADGVCCVFAEDLQTRCRKGQAGVQYIKENQTYDVIAEKLLRFTEE